MAQFPLTLTLLSFFIAASFLSSFVISQPPLNSAEQESVYRVLESINSDISWRTLFPDDFCTSAPHGIVCEYFPDTSASTPGAITPHVTELSFGLVSDYSPNPPCHSTSTLESSLFSPLTHLKKLFFYKCFTQTRISFPDFSVLSSQNFSSPLEELVFIENPGLVGSLDGKINNLSSLRRLVLTGSSVSGGVLNTFSELTNLEQLTLSRNKLNGEILMTCFQKLKKLKVLDLSGNGFHGNVPESIGNLTELLKIDLSFNEFSGKIPEILKGLKVLEFLDLSYNQLGNFGIPLFLAEMRSVKEVYLSGNFLGGRIPEIWENLEAIRGIGLSRMGLVGNIPKSMAVHLKNLCYLGLDNNNLEGVVPEEFGSLEIVSELNLENNKLSGRLPFSATLLSKLGGKLKLEGNLDLCIDDGLRPAKVSDSLRQLKLCRKPSISKTALSFEENSYPKLHASVALMFMGFFFFAVMVSSLDRSSRFIS